MITGVHRSVLPFRVSLPAHQTPDAIPVIVLREIQLEKPAEKNITIQNSRLQWTTGNTEVFNAEAFLLSGHD